MEQAQMMPPPKDTGSGSQWFYLWLLAHIIVLPLAVFRVFVNVSAGPFNDRMVLATLDAVLIAIALPLATFIVAGYIAVFFLSPVMLLHTTVWLTGGTLVGRLSAIVLCFGAFMPVSANWSREVAARLGTEAIIWLYFAIEMALLHLWAKRLQAREPSDKMTSARLIVLLVASMSYSLFVFLASFASLFFVLHGSI